MEDAQGSEERPGVMSSNAEMPIKPGDVFAGKYKVEKILGVGAMGAVFSARHMTLGENRAIKFMLPHITSNDSAGVERFLREAMAAARLKSHHVVRIYDVDRLEDGTPFIVMEHLEGTNLKEELSARRRFAVDDAARYMIQICEAVGEAHELGIIHRDLKPANLFLAKGPGGAPCVKVLDFGIAKITTDPAAQDMTSTNTIMGSPLYMSPEQIRSTKSVDSRTDIWSLGVILYSFVTGRLPFEADSTYELIARVLSEKPTPPTQRLPDLAPGIEAIILRCLEKDPALRFQSAAELAAALASFSDPIARTSHLRHLDATEQMETQAWRGASDSSVSQGGTRPSQSGVAPPSVGSQSRPTMPSMMLMGELPQIQAPSKEAAAAAVLGAPTSTPGVPPPLSEVGQPQAQSSGVGEQSDAPWARRPSSALPRENRRLFLALGAALAGAGAVVVIVALVMSRGEGSSAVVDSSKSAAHEVQPPAPPSAAPSAQVAAALTPTTPTSPTIEPASAPAPASAGSSSPAAPPAVVKASASSAAAKATSTAPPVKTSATPIKAASAPTSPPTPTQTGGQSSSAFGGRK